MLAVVAEWSARRVAAVAAAGGGDVGGVLQRAAGGRADGGRGGAAAGHSAAAGRVRPRLHGRRPRLARTGALFFWSLFCNFLILIIEVGAVGRRERPAAAGTLRHVQLVAPPAAAAALRTLHLHGRVSRLGIPLSAGTAAP
jgi:hypothetical protein